MSTSEKDRFQQHYDGKPPWDIGKPQQVFVEAADRVSGSVLDAGCGTGENALFFAQRGHKVTGIDFLEQPITEAKRKARDRGLQSSFLVMDALHMDAIPEVFDSVIDCGLFHVFSDVLRDFLRRSLPNRLSVDKGYIFGRSLRDGKNLHCPDSIYVLPHFIGSLTGRFVVGREVTHLERKWYVFSSDHDDKNVALQYYFLLLMTQVLWKKHWAPETDTFPPFAFPDNLKPLDEFSISYREE